MQFRSKLLPHHEVGEDGMNILVNVMGFIILCIGVQFVLDGVVEVVNTRLSS